MLIPLHPRKKFNWTCPYCNRDSTITASNYSRSTHVFNHNNKDGELELATQVIVCPNDACKEYSITGILKRSNSNLLEPAILQWQMKPQSFATSFPDYVPAPIRADYEEACLIRDLSPKASATLSRRCIQGIIRDYWGISQRNLFDEIEAIKDKVDPIIWEAIGAVRRIGNIGAHMEKDINLIIDIDPQEARLLIGLIEILIKDWYIARHERQKNLESIIGVADEKAVQKQGN